MDDEHGNRAAPDDLLGYASHKQAAYAGPPMGGHDDEVAVPVLAVIQYLFCRVAMTN